VHGNVSQAFVNNLMFPYWLFVGGGVTTGLVAYGLGLVDEPDLVGQRTIAAIPIQAHGFAAVTSFLVNVHHYGLNPAGWIWRLFS